MSFFPARDPEPGDALSCDAIELMMIANAKDIDGFEVRRALPTAKRRLVGPFIFFDRMGPAVLRAGKALDVRPHPHIGLSTVTYLFDGRIRHRDSLGTEMVISPGDVNLMTAGRGIVHSEREQPQATARERRLHGLQLWLALPQADEETDPAFHHYPGADIPALSVDGVAVRVMMGTAFGATSPVKVFAQTLYVEAALQAGQRIAVPDVAERAVYVAQGAIHAGDTTIAEHAMAVLRTGPGRVLEAHVASRIAIIGGENPGPRFIDWNFVSSRKERIAQARSDWREGRFPKVPGDETEFIALP